MLQRIVQIKTLQGTTRDLRALRPTFSIPYTMTIINLIILAGIPFFYKPAIRVIRYTKSIIMAIF